MNAAVIIETRNNARIPEIVEDHLKYLPGFELVVFCAKSNIKHFDQFNCQKYFVNVHNLSEYNRLMTSLNFWDKLKKFNRVLIFQTDSRILREGIEMFLEFDFIGAPIKNINFPCMNGGLSLRNPKTMIRTIEKQPYHAMLGHEDIFYCNILADDKTANLPTKEIAKLFSVETMYNLGSFGIHAANKYLNHDQYEKIKNQYQ